MTRRTLFLTAWAIVALLTKIEPGSAHVMSRLGTVESIVDRHTYQLDDSSFVDTIDKIKRDGHFYSHQPPLLSTLEAPVYWLLQLPGTRFNNRGRYPMIAAFSWLTNGLALALTVVVVAQMLTRTAVPEPTASALSLVLVFGTWLLPYGIVPNNHGISALLLAVLCGLLYDIDRDGPTGRRLAGTGIVLGLLVAFEWLPIVSFIPAVIGYLGLRRDLDRRGWAAFLIALGVPLLAHSVINVQITGDIIPAGFHTELFRYEGSAFEESDLTGDLKYNSVGAAASYAWQALFSDKAFFVFAPLCVAGLLAGIIEWRWWRANSKGLHLVVMVGSLISLVVALLTTNNFGGEAVGFRHAVFLCPAFIVMLLPWLANPRARSIVFGIAAVSTVSMLLFAARQPWSVLTLTHAPIGNWDQYLPALGRLVRGGLFNPN